MHLRLVSDFYSEKIFDEINFVLNHARIDVKNVKRDKKSRSVSVPIFRYGIKPNKNRFLGIGRQYAYDFDTKIKSLVVLKNVEELDVVDKTDNSNQSEMQILFGFAVTGNEIYLCSAEYGNETLFSIKVKVRGFDVEIRDEKMIR